MDSNSSQQTFAGQLLTALLRVALVFALCAAVWTIYRRLPHDERASLDGATTAQPTAATALHIILRHPSFSHAPAAKIPVQLYPVNMMAAQRDYDSEHRPGVRFEDFVMRRMGERQPLAAELDEHGETVVAVQPGKWWVHATLFETGGAEEVTWRLPVNVSGRDTTVELTPENAYTRARSF